MCIPFGEGIEAVRRARPGGGARPGQILQGHRRVEADVGLSHRASEDLYFIRHG